MPRVQENVTDLTKQYIEHNQTQSGNNVLTQSSIGLTTDLKMPASSTILTGGITSMTIKGSQSTVSLESHAQNSSNTSDISGTFISTISNGKQEPVSLIIYELDYVLATMTHKIDEMQEMYENNDRLEIDHAEYLQSYSIESLIQKRQQEQAQGKLVSNSVEIDLKNPFLLMFGGLDRVVQVKKHLGTMSHASMQKQQEMMENLAKTSSVGSLSDKSSASSNLNDNNNNNNYNHRKRKSKSKSKSSSKSRFSFGSKFRNKKDKKHKNSNDNNSNNSNNIKQPVQVKNPKCFIFTPNRPTLFVVMLLKQIGINDMFVTIGNNQVRNEATGEIEIERVELSHVICSDHLLMKQNENKTHLIR